MDLTSKIIPLFACASLFGGCVSNNPNKISKEMLAEIITESWANRYYQSDDFNGNMKTSFIVLVKNLN